ncbi:hypothetical protein ZIOFF_041475 [Zingiber officinale]|uniref:Uncharacterized protein n=1 Tax=Zingiber officinale TaxID=94328 RepID=A0A8J5GDS9_ZINOF|nr:hypothetical protein ZIOFF_041475 [Zingiber officinale]
MGGTYSYGVRESILPARNGKDLQVPYISVASSCTFIAANISLLRIAASLFASSYCSKSSDCSKFVTSDYCSKSLDCIKSLCFKFVDNLTRSPVSKKLPWLLGAGVFRWRRRGRGLNLRATELRLGQPGSESHHRDDKVGLTVDLLPKSFASGAKRGFFDAIDNAGKWEWGLATGEGGSEVDLVKGGCLLSTSGQASEQGNVGKVAAHCGGSIGRDRSVAPAAKRCFLSSLEISSNVQLYQQFANTGLSPLGVHTELLGTDVAEGNLASIYYEQSQLDMAILHYKQAINCDSTFIEAYNNCSSQTAANGLVNTGNTFKEIGRVTETIQDYMRAVNIRPTMPEAHANLASAYKDSLQFSSTPELKLMKCGSSGLNAC